MIFEVCIDSVQGAKTASKYAVKRVELCSALSIGGLTPNVGLVEECCQVQGVEVHTMLRHKEGNFQYCEADVEIMRKDMIHFAKLGIKGVVFGILDEHQEVSELNKTLLQEAKSLGLEATFHRAFDFVSNPEESIKKLVDWGFTRVLTSGCQPTAIEGIDLIAKLNDKYGEDIQIMAGSGVNAQNALVFEEKGIKNLHFTAKKLVGQVALSMGEQTVVDEDKIKSITHLFA